MKDKFVHLHVHSSYSFQDGIGLPEQYIDRCEEIGQPALAVTDHGNVSSHYKWYKQCSKKGIIPILGCEMYIVKDLADVRTRDYNHITVLVQNNIGYKNLMKLVTKAWCEQFYYKPRITFQDLFDNQEGLIVLSGCLSSPVMEILKDKENPEGLIMALAEENLDLFKKNISNFYIEFQPIDFEAGILPYNRLVKLYNEKLKDKGFKGVVTNDCHYVVEEQSKTQEILLCVQTRDTIDNPEHWKFDSDGFFLRSRQQMEDAMKKAFPEHDFSDEMDETVRVSELIDFEFPKAEPIKFPMPDEDKNDHLKAMCYEGMKKRELMFSDTIGKNPKLPLNTEKEKLYQTRLDYEIDLIVKKNFVDYFLVIADLVQWAKKQGILVGPARGSSAGSLACYALAITEIDPLEYGLIFERFIDLNREDLPDVDIDFEDARRHEVKQYLEDKYGVDKVGNLPTFAVFQGKSALDDVGRVFRIPFKVIDQVKKAIIERSGGDSRASFTLEDTFNSDVFEYPREAMKEYPVLKHAIELEGQIRQMGVHAAGVMIANKPITDFCAVYMNQKDKTKTISLEYKDASDIGLLKIDLLGLNTLSVISTCLKLIKERHNKKIDMYKLPLNDPKVYKAFRQGKLFGIFQFDGQAVNQVCRQVNPKEFESLSAISALARPGPLNSGNTTEYIMRKSGKAEVKFVHPIMKSITGDSYGIVIYQEQIMRIMREIGEMSWKDTSEIRKLISKSQGVEKFNTFKSKFIPGALKNGLSEAVANKIWDEMCHYGSWSFNKSHSVSYSVISYWTQWLKVHYPMEFYGSILALTKQEDKKKKILKEYKKEGYKVLPVDINLSKQHFTIEEEGLRVGFCDIKNIGDKAGNTIVKRQPYSTYTEFMKKNEGKRMTTKVIKQLIDLGAFDSIGNNQTQVNLFGEITKEYEKEELSFTERFTLCPWDMEFGIDKNWLPVLQKYPTIFKQLPMRIDELKETEGVDDVIIYGIVYDKNLKDAREEASSKGKNIDLKKYRGLYQFANFVVEDDHDFITVRMSHIIFPHYGKLIFEELRPDDVVIIRGKMGSGIRLFFANKIMSLRQFLEEKENGRKETTS